MYTWPCKKPQELLQIDPQFWGACSINQKIWRKKWRNKREKNLQSLAIMNPIMPNKKFMVRTWRDWCGGVRVLFWVLRWGLPLPGTVTILLPLVLSSYKWINWRKFLAWKNKQAEQRGECDHQRNLLHGITVCTKDTSLGTSRSLWFRNNSCVASFPANGIIFF